ncbi:CRISPR-associated endonuclease Cas2 [Patescibacteria group bacterium]|nr:CRISPR-associated endonuclease Cas2 [Patescibacteria group bacterium]MBU4452871.1 CRISPR-associated endonuclease Cas2 [Patescibacteria group bacterium]MCG2687295.1 CRISPR-associated endonuclease Cas2 [Candidatus Parcubacteria bacterium]
MKSKFLKSNSQTTRLLIRIGDGLENICFTLENSRLVMSVGIDDARTILWRREQTRIRRTMRQLKEKKLIKVKKVGNKYNVLLTDEGMIEYLHHKLIDCNEFEDDQVTMVIFDIPETQRQVRKQLRRFLEEACFMPIQKSVWISKFDSGEILSNFFQLKGRQKWIRVFKAKRLS